LITPINNLCSEHIVKFLIMQYSPVSLPICWLVLLKHDLLVNHVSVTLDHSPVYRVTVPYAACIQLYPPEDENLRLETCRKE